MTKILRISAILALLVAGLAFTAGDAAAACPPNTAQMSAWDGTNWSGTFLGYTCGFGYEHNYGDNYGVFQGLDNDHQSSFRLYGVPARTVCVEFFKDANEGGPLPITYRQHNGGVLSIGQMPTGWNNTISSVSVFEVQFGASCLGSSPQ